MTGDNHQQGTTLIELLVAISIFAIIITLGSELLASALANHQQAMEKAEILNQASYALDYTSRALRMVQKDLVGNCITKMFNYQNYPVGNLSVVRFLNYQGKCVELALEELGPAGQKYKALTIKRSSDGSAANLGSSAPLTSKTLSVEGLNFKINGQGQGDLIQPSVSMALKIKGRSLNPQEMRIQTTVSQRDLDVQY